MWRSLGAGFGAQLDGPAGPKRGAAAGWADLLEPCAALLAEERVGLIFVIALRAKHR
jgi:hypothetical protein